MKRSITISASVSVAALLTASGAMAAPIQWSSADGGNDHWYEINTSFLSWEDAKTAAEERGGYLATVTSAAENDFINNLAAGLFDALLWLGGTDAGTEGDWYWATGPEAGTQFWEGGKDGNPVGDAYTNWAITEPNDFLFSEDYLAMLISDQWYDTSGSLWLRSVVEYDTNPFAVPEPSTAALALAGLAGLALHRRRRKTA